MVGIKDTKTSMILAFVALTALFFLALRFLPAYSDDGTRRAFLILFAYSAAMFGFTWKFMWKLVN